MKSAQPLNPIWPSLRSKPLKITSSTIHISTRLRQSRTCKALLHFHCIIEFLWPIGLIGAVILQNQDTKSTQVVGCVSFVRVCRR